MRQIKKHFGSIDNLPEQLKGIFQDINSTYESYEDDAQLLQNSIEISSQELRDAFQKHKQDANAQKETINKIKEAIFALNPLDQENITKSETTTSDSSYLFDSLLTMIAERKQAEVEILKLSKAVEQNPASIVITNINGIIEYVNPKFCNLTGYTKEEAIGQNPRILKSDSTPHEYFEKLWETILPGHEWRGELQNKKKNGELYWESALISPIINENRITTHFIAIKEDITERKRAEEERIRQAGLITSLLDSIPDIIFFKDTDGFYLGCNPPFAEFVGKSKNEIIGRNDYDLFDKETAELFRIFDKEMLLQKRPRHNEEWITYPDGRKKLIDTLKTPYWAGDGSLIGLLGISRDITKRKEVEDALQISSKKFEAIISASPDGIGMVSLDGKIQLMSEKLAAIHGYSVEQRDEYVDKTIFDFIDPSNYNLLKTNINNLLEGKKDQKITEYFAIRKDNSRFYIDVNSTVLYDANGKPTSILFVERDITERKKSEEALYNERVLFRTVIDLLPDAVYVKDIEGRKILANPMEIHFAGKESEDEIIGKTDFNLYPGKEAQRSFDEDQIVLKTGKSILGIEGTLMDREHHLHWLLGSKVPLFDQQGRTIGIVGVNRDITAQKQAEDALRESESMQRILLDTLPAGVVIIDPVTMIIDRVNDYVCTIFGASADHLIGHRCHSLLCPADEGACPVCDLGKSVDNSEREMLRVDGSRLPILKTVKRVQINGQEKLLECFVDVSERKQAEEKLKESEANFRTFFETIDDMVFIANQQGEIFNINASVTRKLGYSVNEILGMRVLDVHPPYKRAEAEQIFSDMFANRRDTCPLPIERKDGTLIPVETRIWFGKWDGNDCIFGISKDLSKEQESLQKFNKIFENNPALMAISTYPERIFTDVNQAFSSITGYTKEEVIGKTSAQLNLFIQADKQNKATYELSEKGFIDNYELKVRDKSGHTRDGIFSGEIIESQGKKYFLTVMIDITEIKKLEEDIKLQNSFYKIVATVSERLIQADSESLDIEINHSLAILGSSNQVDRSYIFELDPINDEVNNTYEWCADGINPEINQLQGIPFSSLPHWKEVFLKKEHIFIESVSDLPEDRKLEREILEPQGIQSLVTVPMYYGSSLVGFIGFDSVASKKLWNEQVLLLLKIYASVLAGVIFKKKTEAALLNAKRTADIASKAKSEFLANMSHEIRTPLNGVIGFTDLLLKTPLNKIQQQYAENANISGHSLLGIINDILDFSKIEAGKMELDINKTDIIELAEQASDIIKYHASLKGIELLLNIQVDLPRFILADSIRLKQILVNLLSNAVKFTESGEVELKVKFTRKDENTGEFHFSVRDTGIGISGDLQKNLFKAFTQADSSTTRRFGGTGLGLTISSMLAEKMGSKIEIISETGKGSNFFFTIETEYEIGEKLHEGSLNGIKNILVIDDNDNNRMILEHTLKSWDIEFVGVDNGLSALKIIENSKPFDVIIVDYHMPYLNGLDTIKMIREKLHLTPEKQPVILLHSSSEDIEIDDECKRLGVRFNLIKPVKSQQLLHYLKNIHTLPNPKIKELVNALQEESTILAKNISPVILVAEDVFLNMVLVTTIIKQTIPNVILLEAKNGKQALEMTILKNPDLILMDIQMPEMSGIEATLKIRNYEKAKGSRIPIIALTAGAIKGEKEKCLEAGMDDFLTKPINQVTLNQILEKNLGSFFQTVANSKETVKLDIGDYHFDKTTLMENMGNDQKLLYELFEEVPKQFSLEIKLLGIAIAERKMEDAKRIAHSLKGTSYGMCFNQLAELSKELELSIFDEDFNKLDLLFHQIILEWEQLQIIIKDIEF